MPRAQKNAAPKATSHPGRDRATEGGDRTWSLAFAALGIVYGDIGTSPLYALRECFYGEHALAVVPANVLGVLSLIFWALTIVISLKYLLYVMRADNHGEGGILALLALLKPWGRSSRSDRKVLIWLGLFGAALLYGDGTITPAISVLSAIEGLELAAPGLAHFVVPVTVGILVLLFALQHHGTATVGAIFGPVMAVWFVCLAVLGLRGIVSQPAVLAAVDPRHAVAFFFRNGTTAFAILGTVFLVVTGGEALYADMGHFGRRPIRLAWFGLVLPTLLLNYFGQAAFLLGSPTGSVQTFYRLAPSWALLPLIGLATAATVIASQAVISGAFSLTRQAIQLGQCPRMRVIQTSSEEIGQIYLPFVNAALMIGTIALVLGFGSSSRLAAAYGVAVTSTMVITTVLAFFVAVERWDWSLPVALLVTGALLVVDLAFFSANLLKIGDGGWFPLLVGAAVFTLMSTWRRGRELLRRRLDRETEPMRAFLERIKREPPHRVPGTAIFLTGRSRGVPPMLLHHLEHNQVLHERIVLLTTVTEETPRVPASERLDVEELDKGFYRILVHYGFMQSPNVPVALRLWQLVGPEIDREKTTFYLGRETLIPTDERPGMMLWREHLFAFLSRNAARATAFYNIPPDRVVELGIQVEL